MRVGEVVQRSGVSRKALRVYEARGILPPPKRTASGYRVYLDNVLDVLAFVQQGRRLGLTLAEIAHIITLRRSGSAPCVHVQRLLQQKAAALEAVLAAVHGVLKSWPRTNGRHAAICPHIESKGGEVTWKSSPSRYVRPVRRARKSSSRAIRSASVRTRTRLSLRKRNGTSSLT